MQQPAFFDLCARAKFRLTGTDRSRFLNGQITNDLRKANEKVAIEACVLNAKGKLNAHIFLSPLGESFLIDAEAELRQALATRLERYVIADDVQIEDVTDEFVLFHILAEEQPKLEASRIVSVHRFATHGWDIWSAGEHYGALRDQLSSTFAFIDSAAAEVMRIEQGLSRWGCELTDSIIPIEANLERRTIDYEKGCYIGQEVVSRMKMSGQTNKRLCGLISLDDSPFKHGMKLASSSNSEREVGWITSATRSERLGKEIALGYIKRGFNNPGTNLTALLAGQPGSIPAQVVSLPFL
jgi:tRNA-modifying protein YgfZ